MPDWGTALLDKLVLIALGLAGGAVTTLLGVRVQQRKVEVDASQVQVNATRVDIDADDADTRRFAELRSWYESIVLRQNAHIEQQDTRARAQEERITLLTAQIAVLEERLKVLEATTASKIAGLEHESAEWQTLARSLTLELIDARRADRDPAAGGG